MLVVRVSQVLALATAVVFAACGVDIEEAYPQQASMTGLDKGGEADPRSGCHEQDNDGDRVVDQRWIDSRWRC